MAKEITYYEGLPLIYLSPEDVQGVEVISLVDHPANETKFVALAAEAARIQRFSLQEEKRIVTGVALIPDQRIYRCDAEGNEWYVTFTREAIARTAQKFMRNHRGEGVNIQHAGAMVDGLYYCESYLTDPDRGISPAGFGELPAGTWIVSCKVDNPEVWARIKSGELRGFSIEGVFGQAWQCNRPLDSLEDLIRTMCN